MLSFFRGDVSKDPDILKLVQNQTTQWTDCMHKQRKEEWGMLKGTIHKLRRYGVRNLEMSIRFSLKSRPSE